MIVECRVVWPQMADLDVPFEALDDYLLDMHGCAQRK
jgi:hypothetical protein